MNNSPCPDEPRQHAKRTFRVLSCSGEKFFAAVWKHIVQQHLGDAYQIEVTEMDTGVEIIEFVRRQSIDLIVAMVNNIRVPHIDVDDRIHKVVELLARLKAENAIHVIAFSGFEPKSFDLPELVKKSGIDAFLWTPFEMPDAVNALDDCLKILDGSPQKTREITPPHSGAAELD